MYGLQSIHSDVSLDERITLIVFMSLKRTRRIGSQAYEFFVRSEGT